MLLGALEEETRSEEVRTAASEMRFRLDSRLTQPTTTSGPLPTAWNALGRVMPQPPHGAAHSAHRAGRRPGPLTTASTVQPRCR